jgi:hypothetical protein
MVSKDKKLDEIYEVSKKVSKIIDGLSETPVPKKNCYLGIHIPEQYRAKAQNACWGEVKYKHEDENYYCLMHYPSATKADEFKSAFEDKLANEYGEVTEFLAKPTEEQVLLDKKVSVQLAGIWFPEEIEFHLPKKFPLDTLPDKDRKYFKYHIDLTCAVFNRDADFGEVNFEKGADFTRADFAANVYFSDGAFGTSTTTADAVNETEDANFIETIFAKTVLFGDTKFYEKANFERAFFDEGTIVKFEGTTFLKEANFEGAIFKGYVRFDESKTPPSSNREKRKQVEFSAKDGLNLRYAYIEKPEQITFNSVNLRPSWLVLCDARKFNLINVDWTEFISKKAKTVKNEIDYVKERLKNEDLKYCSNLLSLAYRQIAANSEENNHFEQASHFRRMTFEAERFGRREDLKKWRAEFGSLWAKEEVECKKFIWKVGGYFKKIFRHLGGFPWGILHRLYRFSSFYGESVGRAFFWFFTIWLVFACLYPFVHFSHCPPEPKSASNNSPAAGNTNSDNKNDAANNNAEPAKTESSKAEIDKTKRLCDDSPLSWRESANHSLGMLFLQPVDAKPMTNMGIFLVFLERFLGFVQLALLVLAIRRKFMR